MNTHTALGKTEGAGQIFPRHIDMLAAVGDLDEHQRRQRDSACGQRRLDFAVHGAALSQGGPFEIDQFGVVRIAHDEAGHLHPFFQ